MIIGNNFPLYKPSARNLAGSIRIVMVGDRLYTDIAMGKNGIHTVLVLSGETKIEDLRTSTFQPDLVIGSVKELIEAF